MYAIVEIAGQQFKVEEGKKIFVHHLETAKDEIVEFDRVLLVEDNEKILVGEPTVANFIVEGKLIDHVKGDKVIVFKKKRKKGYRVKKGHRQNFSQIEITGIREKGSIVRKEAPKKAKAVKEVLPETIKEPAEEKKPAARKVTAKKPAAQKPAAKKAAVKTETKEEGKPKTKKTIAKKETVKKPAARKAPKKKE
jgi:large subunit ribosomal protein L21